ncbi:hypothetical protein BBW65_00775 [Helicobacter enhydrae]|uniref:Cytochrome c domain-containing protein n=1 Tax=Helicobacter enhydrae TaxID=222136 RepID=A0A1B1U415_9HELI|nr:cytochrome c [Helicobacter enhydrae]ANV97435.1 hypothetical protein BBW65_00775 [Helicobacter enhydrae]
MKQKLLLLSLLIVAPLLSQDERGDFIDELEYGKRLYENPRGISCIKCHGSQGEGKIIATYKHNGRQKELKAPKITEIDFKKFKKAINESEGIMPKYYLTDKEISAIYHYLNPKTTPNPQTP